jgi:hemoglobin
MAKERLYERIGGAAALHKLVNIFYNIVAHDPEGEILNALHLRGHGIAHSRIAQFHFLSGFLGGPQLYVEKHGHSNIRDMHRHVPIGPTERDAWLGCMNRALSEAGIEADISTLMLKHFHAVAHALEQANRT